MEVTELALDLNKGSYTIDTGHENGRLAFLSRRIKDRLRVRRPRKLIHPVIMLRQQISDCFGRAVIQHQPEFIALVTGPRLRTPRQILPVWRVSRIEVAAGRSRDFRRLRRRIGQVERVDLRADGEGRFGIGVLGVGQLLRIGRNSAPAAPALQRKRRDIMRIVRR